MPKLRESFSKLPRDVRDALISYYGSPEKVIKYLSNLHESFSQLSIDVQDALVRYYGSPEKVIEYFVARFRTYATEVMDSIGKRNNKLGPNDPIIGVNVATGRIHFNYLDEFNNFPWDDYNPRPGSHMEALKLFKAINNENEDSDKVELGRAV
ncbi:hypothetical protein SAMN05660649_04910 [Desulfotomaculum arcticum]|uniref:Uncharacterized protein n=1 Tax=Desulfotruncus arcticus DSM 17038 TaxID=1121424 RepID=A0A1I2ZFA3_9FIRM|nr:hypothetical protein [Desulfotruncus arcticus]SFH36390.1 hypothetical protein SAMN05660649_04910 [Desulfotomaculum arcticum] [Desulfotruncus arcticus DSM 17038]